MAHQQINSKSGKTLLNKLHPCLQIDHRGVNQPAVSRPLIGKRESHLCLGQTAHRLKVLSKQVILANLLRAVDEHDQKSQPLHYHGHLKAV